ncbi:MAG: hypothetical protein WCD69_21750 [Xanthobacteraceae bacterium]
MIPSENPVFTPDQVRGKLFPDHALDASLAEIGLGIFVHRSEANNSDNGHHRNSLCWSSAFGSAVPLTLSS